MFSGITRFSLLLGIIYVTCIPVHNNRLRVYAILLQNTLLCTPLRPLRRNRTAGLLLSCLFSVNPRLLFLVLFSLLCLLLALIVLFGDPFLCEGEETVEFAERLPDASL